MSSGDGLVHCGGFVEGVALVQHRGQDTGVLAEGTVESSRTRPGWCLTCRMPPSLRTGLLGVEVSPSRGNDGERGTERQRMRSAGVHWPPAPVERLRQRHHEPGERLLVLDLTTDCLSRGLIDIVPDPDTIEWRLIVLARLEHVGRVAPLDEAID